MRAILCTLALATALVGCGSSPDAKQAEEVAALKKRITKLENRVRALEGRAGRGKAPPRGKAPTRRPPAQPTGPTLPVTLGEDVKAAVLVGAQGKVKLPGQVGPGKYSVMAALGDAPLERKNIVFIGKDVKGPQVLTCDAAANTCALGPAGK